MYVQHPHFGMFRHISVYFGILLFICATQCTSAFQCILTFALFQHIRMYFCIGLYTDPVNSCDNPSMTTTSPLPGTSN